MQVETQCCHPNEIGQNLFYRLQVHNKFENQTHKLCTQNTPITVYSEINAYTDTLGPANFTVTEEDCRDPVGTTELNYPL